MTTTFDAIRAQQMTVIEALTPSSHSAQRFRRHREAIGFGEFVAKSPRGSFRRFEILRTFDDEQLPTADGYLEGVRHSMELRVAYPLEPGLYGADNERGMERVFDEDRRLIDAAIGLNGGANYVASLHDCHFTAHGVIDDVEGARLLSITYALLYDRSV